MNRRIIRSLYPVFLLFLGSILALTSAVFSPGLYDVTSYAGAASLSQALTPTPIPTAVSRAGSTDGIMLMGVVIVIIILLPILLRRGLWTK
jgi:hypothetical protein